jgi:hypothetical protein
MWKIIRNLLILLAVIGTVAAAVVLMVNNSSLAGFEPQAGTGAAGVQQPSSENQPAFQGERQEREGGSSFWAEELLKNLGIISATSAAIILLEKSFTWIKGIRKASSAQP